MPTNSNPHPHHIGKWCSILIKMVIDELKSNKFLQPICSLQKAVFINKTEERLFLFNLRQKTTYFENAKQVVIRTKY